MKVTISFEGDTYEDDCEIKTILAAGDIASALFDSRATVRGHLKHNDNLNTEAERVLEELQQLLYDEGWGIG